MFCSKDYLIINIKVFLNYLFSHNGRIILFIRLVNFIYFKSINFRNLAYIISKRIISIFLTKSYKKKLINFFKKFKFQFGLKELGPRYYLKKDVSVEFFFKSLFNKKYVLLRWFEQYPNLSKTEDYDILISEDDFNFAVKLCDPYPNGGQPIDFYTPNGLNFLNYNGTSYFPSELAKDILNNTELFKNKIKVPNSEYHLLSLAYHIVFHKGYESGIPKNSCGLVNVGDHNYLKVINNLKEEINCTNALNSLENIYDFLISRNWIPSNEAYNILSRYNKFLNEKHQKKLSKTNNFKGELFVFILREYVAKNNLIEKIKDLIVRRGVFILDYFEFNKEETGFAKNNFRGGNWGKGNFFKSGGDPYAILICFNYSHDLSSNNSTLLKNFIRKEINKNKFFFNQANMIHSADNEFEAIEYIQKISSVIYTKTISSLNKIRKSDYFDRSNLLRIINPNGLRSKVTLIDYKEKVCIKKSFKLNMTRFLEREIYASENLSKSLSSIPKLIDKGNDYIITEYFENILENLSENKKKQVLKNYTSLILDNLYKLWELGYAHIDLNPSNIIITSKNELKICDFEFLYKYKNKVNFLNSFDIKGVPSYFDSDLPKDYQRKSFQNIWAGYFCQKQFNAFLKTIYSKNI